MSMLDEVELILFDHLKPGLNLKKLHATCIHIFFLIFCNEEILYNIFRHV